MMSLFRLFLLVLLHLFLVALWGTFVESMSNIINFCAFNAVATQPINLLLPVVILALYWLVPVFVRRVNVQVAWVSLILALLSIIFSFIIYLKLDAMTLHFGVVELIGDFWLLASSLGLLLYFYARRSRAAFRARIERLKPRGAMIYNTVVFVYTLIMGILLLHLLQRYASMEQVHKLGVILLFLILPCSLYYLITPQKVKYYAGNFLLSAALVLIYTMSMSETHIIDFQKKGEQWQCKNEAEKEGLSILQFTYHNPFNTDFGSEKKQNSLELSIANEQGIAEKHVLLPNSAVILNDKMLYFYGYTIDSDHIDLNLKLIERPQIRTFTLLILLSFAFYLLSRAIRATKAT